MLINEGTVTQVVHGIGYINQSDFMQEIMQLVQKKNSDLFAVRQTNTLEKYMLKIKWEQL